MTDKRNFIYRFYSRITAEGLVKAIGIYSFLIISLISILVLASDASVNEKAVIKMALGLILIWIILGGSIITCSGIRSGILSWVYGFPGR